MTKTLYAQWFEDQDRRILTALLAGTPRKRIMDEMKVSRMKLTRVIKRHIGQMPVLLSRHDRDHEILRLYDRIGKKTPVADQLGIDPRTVGRALNRRERLQTVANNNAFLREAA